MRTRSHPLVLTVLLAATALAGCFADTPVLEDPPVSVIPPPPVDNRTLPMQAIGCTQYSGGVVTEASSVEAYVPPGFGLVRDQQAGQTVQLALIVNVCDGQLAENGTAINATGTYAVVAAPVIPSDEYVDYNYTRNLAPIRLVVQDEAFANRFHEWGLHMTEVGTIAGTTTPGPVGTLMDLTIAGAATYTSNAVLGPIGDTFARNNYRLWVHDGTNITANLLVDNMEGPRIGQGGHVWQASGDDTLPERSGGTMTVGADIAAHYRWVEGALGNPAPIGAESAAGGA